MTNWLPRHCSTAYLAHATSTRFVVCDLRHAVRADLPIKTPTMHVPQGLKSVQQLSHSDLMLAGGLGGTAFWLGCYPLGEI